MVYEGDQIQMDVRTHDDTRTHVSSNMHRGRSKITPPEHEYII